MAKQRAPILRWRGMLAQSSRLLRWMIAFVLAVAGVTLSFTQLGFADLVLPDGSTAYVVVVLEVVALGALLLGTLMGTFLGLVVGGALLIHARFLPLDHYELSFITPETSIFMLGLAGLSLGIFFAFALRNNPTQGRRAAYIVLVCIIVSWLYSITFLISVITQIIVGLVETAGPSISETTVRESAASLALQLGDIGTQAWTTALLMSLLCVFGDYAARKLTERRGSLGVRTVFGAWLSVVVALSFMTMGAVSFAVTSGDSLRDAEDMMKGEANYLCEQMAIAQERNDLLRDVVKQGKLDYDAIDETSLTELSDVLEDRLLLEGYTVRENGIVLVTIGEMVYASNDEERFPSKFEFSKSLRADAVDAINRSLETGQMQRFIFDDLTARESEADSGSKPFIAYVYAQSALALGFERDETGAETDKGIEEHVIIIMSSDQVFAKRPAVMVWMTVASFVLLLAVFAIVFQLLNRVVARGIDEENEALSRITAGNLDTRAEASGTRELESLSEGINETVDALKGWIAEAETRMDAELATAKAIQEAALPRTFPPFPEIPRFDVYASMQAAKQVGGDFYDFFLIGDGCDEESGKLGFVIADVSGKGVPAALFMMKAKALIRDYVGSGMELGEAVTEANRMLCDGNDAGMFVTAWVGVLDYATGHVDYVNAGHNPPLLWQQEEGWSWLKDISGMVLGLFEVPYTAYSVDCATGDTFLLYTDGVTEAYDVDETLYGEERLLAVAEANSRLRPRDLLEAVRADVSEHALGAEQSDDITILSLAVGVAPEATAEIEVPATADQLGRVNDFIHEELTQRLCPHRVQNQLDTAVEELFVNVCHYAYPEASPESPGKVRIRRTYSADPQAITVDIIDDGVRYNPLAKPDPVTPDDIMDVPIGGLGILMAKRSVDTMRYKRLNGNNVVTIVKKW